MPVFYHGLLSADRPGTTRRRLAGPEIEQESSELFSGGSESRAAL